VSTLFIQRIRRCERSAWVCWIDGSRAPLPTYLSTSAAGGEGGDLAGDRFPFFAGGLVEREAEREEEGLRRRSRLPPHHAISPHVAPPEGEMTALPKVDTKCTTPSLDTNSYG
jgi:hypothetical protein